MNLFFSTFLYYLDFLHQAIIFVIRKGKQENYLGKRDIFPFRLTCHKMIHSEDNSSKYISIEVVVTLLEQNLAFVKSYVWFALWTCHHQKTIATSKSSHEVVLGCLVLRCRETVKKSQSQLFYLACNLYSNRGNVGLCFCSCPL